MFIFVLQLAVEKDTCEREKWEIIQKARHAAEQAIYLQQQLEVQEHHSQKLDGEIMEVTIRILLKIVEGSSNNLPALIKLTPCPKDKGHMGESFQD